MRKIKFNRYMKTKPKLGKQWCKGCDSQLVGHGAKCDTCGTLDGIKRFKNNGR